MCISFTLLTLLSFAAAPQDWTNLGGNPQRNGLSPEAGPSSAAAPLWTNTMDFSIISWQPVILGDRVFTVRESGFPQNGGQAHDAVVAYDVDSGTRLWSTTLPFNGNTSQQWIAWIAGAHAGRVYASRASHLQPQPIQALDAVTGSLQWASAASTQAFAYDGCVFTANGDLVVGDWQTLLRIDGSSGATVWNVPRTCPVSGNCGPAATASALYIDEPAAGGQVLTKFDIASGARLYSSSLMPGFTDQNSPFAAPAGNVVYFSRTQNNTAVDFLFAFQDTGTALVELWRRPVRWTTGHEHGIGPDGSIYTFLQSDEFVRLDPATGSQLDSAGVLSPLGILSPKTAVDRNGQVYVANGWASTPSNGGRVWAYDAGLSQNLFTLTLDNPNQGGPALGTRGTLVVCDRFAVTAYRSACAVLVSVEGPGGGPPAAGALNTVRVDCATPGGAVLLAASLDPNGTTAASACGLQWDLRHAHERGVSADAAGQVAVPVHVPARLAGQQAALQAIDVASCSKSARLLVQF